MTVVSSREFDTHLEKYFDIAESEDITFIRGNNIFHLICKPVEKTKRPKQAVLEPDDNFRQAITFDVLLERTYEDIHKIFAKK
jgi:hypothetical protein